MDAAMIAELAELHRESDEAAKNEKIVDVLDRPVGSMLLDGSYGFHEEGGVVTFNNGHVEVVLKVAEVNWITKKPERPTGPVELTPEQQRRLSQLSTLERELKTKKVDPWTGE
jgi:hypothetical protein